MGIRLFGTRYVLFVRSDLEIKVPEITDLFQYLPKLDIFGDKALEKDYKEGKTLLNNA